MHPFFNQNNSIGKIKSLEDSPTKSPLSQSKLAPSYFYRKRHNEEINKSLDFNNLPEKELSNRKGSLSNSNFIGTNLIQKNLNFSVGNIEKKRPGKNGNILDFIQKK